MGRIKKTIDPGQESRTFKSLTHKAGFGPANISGRSSRIGTAQDMLSNGASIDQMMAKFCWSKGWLL